MICPRQQQVLDVQKVASEVERNDLPRTGNRVFVSAGEPVDQEAALLRLLAFTNHAVVTGHLLQPQGQGSKRLSIFAIQRCEPLQLPD
jgi:hypothetical protein